MAPSYKQNTAKIGEIHGTVNLRFKRPVHEGYMVAGDIVLTVAPRECASRHTQRQHGVRATWAAKCWEGASNSSQQTLGKGNLRHITVTDIMDVRQKLNNATQSIDCTMAKAAKWMGLASLTRLQQVFNVPVHELPPAALKVLHLLLNKAKGDNINQHTRPIKVMSAHIRMLTKILNNKLQKLLPP